MTLSFSQRMGLSPLPETLAPDAMPPTLRNMLWNAFSLWRESVDEGEFLSFVWINYWRLPVDEMPIRHVYGDVSYHEAWDEVRRRFFASPWNGVYDFLDFVIGRANAGAQLGGIVNKVFTNELAAYRVVSRQIVRVTDPQEVSAIEEALAERGRFANVSEHLATALAHLSNRQNPDYRNSIKESISAVESMAKIISGKDKAELGEALGALEKTGKLHGALRKGYTALYGYTSDANGIRHALMDEPNLTADDAKYFLITCTAFVNYLKTLA